MSLRDVFEAEQAEHKPLYVNLGGSSLPLDVKPSFYQRPIKLTVEPGQEYNSKRDGFINEHLHKFLLKDFNYKKFKLPESKYYMILKYEKAVFGKLIQEHIIRKIDSELADFMYNHTGGSLPGSEVKYFDFFKIIKTQNPEKGRLRKFSIRWLNEG